jgi:hypothetical protein
MKLKFEKCTVPLHRLDEREVSLKKWWFSWAWWWWLPWLRLELEEDRNRITVDEKIGEEMMM